MNGGFGLVLDGSEEAGKRAANMLLWVSFYCFFLVFGGGVLVCWWCGGVLLLLKLM
jgi:hypothetical protein